MKKFFKTKPHTQIISDVENAEHQMHRVLGPWHLTLLGIGGIIGAGIFVLTASTLYTGPGGAEGPTGITYAATMHVRGTGSVDLFDVIQSQPGCADVGYVFSGDTFEAVTSLHDVAWMCPTCPTCGPTLGYSGTLTTFVVYFPQPDGSTLVQEFTQGPH